MNNGRWGRVVGLTGGLGSGKTTVLRRFKKRGAFVLDADRIVHELLDKSEAVQRRIRASFGDQVFKSPGRVDKLKLAALIFSSPRDRRRLEAILHPRVREHMRTELGRRRGRIAVCDVPLLFESGWNKKFDAVIVVDAAPAVCRARLIKRGLTARDIQARLKAQWPLSKKVREADFLIDNNGTVAQTNKQVDEIWNELIGR